jgi:hypothetical protein
MPNSEQKVGRSGTSARARELEGAIENAITVGMVRLNEGSELSSYGPNDQPARAMKTF